MRWSVRVVCGVGALLAVGLTTSSVGAQIRRAGQPGFEAQFHFELLGQYLARLPRVEINDEERQPLNRVSTGVPVAMLGFGVGYDLLVHDRYVFPVLALETLWTVGRYPTVYGSSGGRAVELHPWNSWQLNMLFSGFGMRWKHRRWMGGFLVQPGLSVNSTDVQRPDEEGSRHMMGVQVMVRAVVEGCRRLDPETRVCLFGGPNVLLDGAFNGGVLGLKMEYGP